MTPETSSPLPARVVDEFAPPKTLAPSQPNSGPLAERASAFVRQIAGRRWSLRSLTFLLVVVLPTLIVFLYAVLWATPQYQSEFRVSVRAAERMQTNSLLPSLLGLGLTQSGPDSNAVVQYILSHEILEEMRPGVDLPAIYGKSSIDWFDRLPSDATAEQTLRYWRRMSEAYYETSTETVVVRVGAFTPADALALAKHTLSLSESLLNRMSARARDNSVAMARKQVAAAEDRLKTLREQIKTLRDKENLLDPRKEAETDLTVSAKLREDLARADADLSAMRDSMDDDAPSVIATKSRIAALRAELDQITTNTVKQRELNRPLSSVFGAFEQLDNDQTFAVKAYQAALASLQSAELDASRQQLYLAVIVEPNLPEESYYPRPLRLTALVFSLALAFWALAALIIASVRDHR
jgi:capsular polysaccharide transport system permease protein